MIELAELRKQSNPGDGAALFSAEGLALLRAAMQPPHPWNDEKIDSSPTLRLALRRICSEGRQSDARPEQFLVALKSVLQSAPAMRRLAPGPERDDYVARIVSLCIKEYYRDVEVLNVATL
jgi:hypothetical protein